MNQSALISVIVPIYNVEKYLRDCIDSILSNSYKHLEILLVDDGSPDNCGCLCDEYAKKDSRITVIHQENKGLVGARNAGLAVASGEYIAFVDSDDMVSPVQFETMASILEMTGADLVGCECCKELSHLCYTRPQIISFHTARSYEEKLALLLSAPSVRNISWTGCYVCDKLYKKAFIQELFNEKCLICEDIDFNWNYIQSCGDFVTIPDLLYYYRQNEESVTSRFYRLEAPPMQAVSTADTLEKMAQAPISDSALRAFFSARLVYTAHSALLRIYCTRQPHHYKKEILRMNRQILDNFQFFQKDQTTYNLATKLSIILYRYAFPIWFVQIRLYQLAIKLRSKHRG